MNKKKTFITKRAINLRTSIVFILVAALGFSFFGLVFANLQINDPQGYKEKAAREVLGNITVPANRGTIYDANMNILAQSTVQWEVFLDPVGFGGNDQELTDAIVHVLSQTLNLEKTFLHEEIKKGQETKNRYVIIAQGLTREKSDVLKKALVGDLELEEETTTPIESGTEETTANSAVENNETTTSEATDGASFLDRLRKKVSSFLGRDKDKEEPIAKPAMNDTQVYTRVGTAFAPSISLTGKEIKLLKKEGAAVCVGIKEAERRMYPANNAAANLIGFINKENEGVVGIESFYNEALSGTQGRKITPVDSKNRAIPSAGGTIIDPQDGVDMVLSIDTTIQGYLDTALSDALAKEKAKAGYGIVMDVKTGAILAMSNLPAFDPNNPSHLIDKEKTKEIEKIKNADERTKAYDNAVMSQWNSGAISFSYDPGSVFKVITAAAGLEEGAVNLKETISCPGYIMLGERRINCHLTGGHGTQNFTLGLMNSCNPWFVTVGQRLGIESFMKYFEAFGFTESTGIDLFGELQPMIGVNYHNKSVMTRGDLASSSFGQTFQATPLQMLTALAALGNGGKLMEPYIVASKLDAESNTLWERTPYVRRQVVSEKVAGEVTKMMEEVVNSGGGANAYVTGYHVAGKTGTSEKLTTIGTNKEEYIASFACVAPSNDPEIAVIIVVDEPNAGKINGSTISAPVAGIVVEKTLNYLNIEPRYSDSELAVLNDLAPDVANLSVVAARTAISGKGMKAVTIGNGEKVLSQSPVAGAVLPKNGVIVLYTTGEKNKKATVPDFSGMTVSMVRESALKLGINVKISGNFQGGTDSTAYKQGVGAGGEVALGSTVSVNFRSASNGNDLA